MSISDKLKIMKISLKGGADTAVKKSQNLIKYSDLSLSLGSYEKDISELYEELGRQVYELYKSGEQNPQEIANICKEIKELEEDIIKVKNKIMKLKDKKECKSCGNLIDKKAYFCDKCGDKQ